MYKYLEDNLRQFIKRNGLPEVENTGSPIWRAEVDVEGYGPLPVINVVFSRYQGNNINETIVNTNGYVLAIPSYWINIDVEVAIIYISSFVDKWLNKYFGYTIPSYSNKKNGAPVPPGDDKPGCNCNCNGKPHLPMPGHPVPPPPTPPCPGDAMGGMFIPPPPPKQPTVIEGSDPNGHGYPVGPEG